MKLPPPLYKAIVGIILLVITLAPVSLSLSSRAQLKINDGYRASITLGIDTRNVSAAGTPTQSIDPNSEEPAPSPCTESAGWFVGFTSCDIGVLFVQIIFYNLSAILVRLSGAVFDFFLWFTMQSTTYSSVAFIDVGWGIIRDLSNIILVVALIYAAVKIMFGIGGGGGRKIVISVIIAAVLINFSLFFTKIVIDASHILARVFYNEITVENLHGDPNVQVTAQEDMKQFSVVIMKKISPQKILSQAGIMSNTQNNYKTTFFTAHLFLGLINITLIGVFLSVALLFIGRTIGLMFGMVMSPIALASYGIPELKSRKYIGFSTWFNDLLGNAFMLPIFMFFFYLAALFLKVGSEQTINRSLGVMEVSSIGTWLNVAIPLVFILVFLKVAKSAAESMAGTIAQDVTSMVKKGIGVVAGAALGGAALVGVAAGGIAGRGLGRLGAAASAKGGAMVGKGGFFNKLGGGMMKRAGKLGVRGGSGMRKGTWDMRNINVMGQSIGSLATAGVGISNLDKTMLNKMSADAREEERTKRQRDMTEEEVKFRTHGLRKKKEKEEQEKMLVEAEMERIKDTDDYKKKKEEKQQKVDDTASEIKDASNGLKEERKKLEQMINDNAAMATTHAAGIAAGTIPAGTPAPVRHNTDALKDQRDKVRDRELSTRLKRDEYEKEKESLEDGSFFDNSNIVPTGYIFGKTRRANATEFEDDKEMLKDLNKEARELRAGIGTRTEAQIKADIDNQKKAMRDKAKNSDTYQMWVSGKDKKVAEEKIKKTDQSIKSETATYLANELKTMQSTLANIGQMITSGLIAGAAGALVGGMTSGISLGQGIQTGLLTGTSAGRALLAGGVAGAGIGAGIGALGAVTGGMSAFNALGATIAAGVSNLAIGATVGGITTGSVNIVSAFMNAPEVKALREQLRGSLGGK